VAAKINALGWVVATYGQARVSYANGSYLFIFGTGSKNVPMQLVNNLLWPVTFGRVTAKQSETGQWLQGLRLMQAPVAFTSADDVVLPPAPTVTEIQAGGSEGSSAWNEIQGLYVPPNFQGSFVLTMGTAKSGLLTVADDPKTIAAALASLAPSGGIFTVTQGLQNTANINFGGTMAGEPYALLGVTVVSAPPGSPTLTIKFDRDELFKLLAIKNPVQVPLELWVTAVDPSTGVSDTFAALVTTVTIRMPAFFADLEETPTINWLRPFSPVSYVPFGVNNVITGQQFYVTPLGDGEATSFSIAHGLDTDNVVVWARQNVTPGYQLVQGEDYSVQITNANTVTVTALAITPAAGAWAVTVISAQTVAAFASGLTVSIGQVTGLAAALSALTASVDSILVLLPTAPPSATAAGGSAISIAIPSGTGYVPANVTASNGLPKPRALLPAQFTAADAVGAASFPLGAAAAAGTVLQNQTDVAQLVPAALGVDEAYVPVGGYVASDGRMWYVVNQFGTGNSFFPAAFERQLFSYEVNSAMMTAGSLMQLQFSIALQTLQANTRCQYILVVELGSIPQDSSPSPVGLNLQNVVWNTDAPVLSQQIIVTDLVVTHGFGISVALDSTGTVFTSQAQLYGRWVAARAVPSSANFAVRARLICFDVEDGVTRPRGVVSWALSAPANAVSIGAA
jgi:hypothetical protein